MRVIACFLAQHRLLPVLLLVLLLEGCALTPVRPPQPSSVAVPPDPGASALARHAARRHPAERSVFLPVLEPEAALQARLELIAAAERSLDLQYFIWNDDDTGRLLLAALHEAAQRGVRVRLLLDHLYSGPVEDALEALAGHPNADVRMFNPLTVRAGVSALGKLLGALGEFARIRHRMHNKLMVADNAVALAGGRNIGDEYLTQREGNFLDLDLLVLGPIVGEMSESFDDYWNSDFALSVKWSWVTGQLRTGSARMPSPSAHARSALLPLGTRHPLREVLEGTAKPHVCPARLFADPVEKAAGTALDDSAATLHQRLIQLFVDSHTSIHTVSPYFVRGRLGVERIQGLIRRGVRIRLLTNSLATTDEPLAHAVYARYRRDLLRAGMEIRELKASRGGLPVGGFRASRLHAKLSIIDERHVYVGSLNFTSRSEHLNTELGLILDCPALARELLALAREVPAYDLRLLRDPERVEWVDRSVQPERVAPSEPGATPWRRLQTTLLDPFIPEEEI